MNNIKEKLKFISEKIRKDKKVLLAVIAGGVLIFALAISEFAVKDNKNQKAREGSNETAQSSNINLDNYSSQLENRLAELISSINGVGKVKVMITLESSEKSVYATSENIKKDKESEDYDSQYILIKSGSSKEEALLINILQPKVRGVAVVCQGADNVYVKQRILDTLSAVLDVNSTHISITPMG
ncbi:MAG: hypothetical protein K5917_05380 [Clostridiales bacterium]|nr:hypothetical protein [Clostridiales bacterium]